MKTERGFYTIDVFNDKEKFNLYLKEIEKDIINSKSFETLLFKIKRNYKLLFFSLTFTYLSKEDFNIFLKEVWVIASNPNKDRNVTKKQILNLFSQADRDLLMNDEEKKVYDSLSDKVKIYRGVKDSNDSNAFSWTLDYHMALWFAKRYDGEGYVLEAEINKENIFAFFNIRNEQEIIVNYHKIKNINCEVVKRIKI